MIDELEADWVISTCVLHFIYQMKPPFKFSLNLAITVSDRHWKSRNLNELEAIPLYLAIIFQTIGTDFSP